MTFVPPIRRTALLVPGANPRIEAGLSVHLMPENPNRAEIARRVDKAEKLLQKGKTADALAEYLQTLEADPQNDNVRQMAADVVSLANAGSRRSGDRKLFESASGGLGRDASQPDL